MEAAVNKAGLMRKRLECRGCSQDWGSPNARQGKPGVQKSSDTQKLVKQKGKLGGSKIR